MYFSEVKQSVRTYKENDSGSECEPENPFPKQTGAKKN